MLQDILLTPEEIALKREVREFVKQEVSSDLIRKMDRDEITYPREFVKALGDRNLLGLRFPEDMAAAAFPGAPKSPPSKRWAYSERHSAAPSPCPRSSVRPSTPWNGRAEGEFPQAAPEGGNDFRRSPDRTPGGSDFFGATTRAELKDGWFTVKGQKRFVVAADGASFIVYCNTDPGEAPERISLILIEKDRPGVEVKYLYKLLGTRGGGTGG